MSAGRVLLIAAAIVQGPPPAPPRPPIRRALWWEGARFVELDDGQYARALLSLRREGDR